MAREEERKPVAEREATQEQDPHSFVWDSFQVELQRSKECFQAVEYYDKVISKERCIIYRVHLYSGS